jgi:hypothetical protein
MVFILKTTQQFDTKIYNHVVSLLHVSAIIRKVFDKDRDKHNSG